MGAARPDSPNLRTRRSALTFLSGAAFTAITIALGFVTTPLLLRWLGAERFGAVRAVSDWLSHLSILEIGLGGALAPLLALALGRSDLAAARRLMVEGIRAFVWVAVATVMTGLLIALVIPYLVPVQPSLARDLRIACLVGLIGLALYPFFPYRVLAEGSQRGYAVNLILLAQSLTITGLALWLAWSGRGITGQLVAIAAGSVVFSVLVTRDGARRFPGLLGAAAKEPRHDEARREIRGLNRPTVLFNLAGRVGLLTDNIVLALILGPARVVPLFLTQRLIVLAQGQLQGIGNASWAALAELHALGRRDVFSARLIELTRLVAALSVVGLVPIAAYNHHFVVKWVGTASFGGDAITILAAVNGYLLALVSLWGWCFSGTGRVAAIVPIMLASAALNLGLSVLATFWLGISGPLVGTLVGLTATAVWYLPLALERAFGTSPLALARAALTPVLWCAPAAAGIVWVARTHTPRGWVGLAAEMAAAALVLLVYWWFVVLHAEERAHLAERVRIARRGASA